MQVRGTPASGKTTLAKLLYGYIARQEENTNVIFLAWWPLDIVKNVGFTSFLESRGWVQGDKTVFIFDNAEVTYADPELWIDLFRSIHDYPTRRAIIFTSYGSPNSRIHLDPGALFQFRLEQRVNIRPVLHNDGLPSVGVFLTWDEFNDLICRKYSSSEHHFHPKFLEEVFKLTVGHVGAIIDFLSVITAHDVGFCHDNGTGNLTSYFSRIGLSGPVAANTLGIYF